MSEVGPFEDLTDAEVEVCQEISEESAGTEDAEGRDQVKDPGVHNSSLHLDSFLF